MLIRRIHSGKTTKIQLTRLMLTRRSSAST